MHAMFNAWIALTLFLSLSFAGATTDIFTTGASAYLEDDQYQTIGSIQCANATHCDAIFLLAWFDNADVICIDAFPNCNPDHCCEESDRSAGWTVFDGTSLIAALDDGYRPLETRICYDREPCIQQWCEWYLKPAVAILRVCPFLRK